jgi:hypothetical protein
MLLTNNKDYSQEQFSSFFKEATKRANAIYKC